MTQISIRLPNHDAAQIDRLVTDGHYKNRTDFVARAVSRELERERDRQIGEQYERAYGDHPFPADDEAWVLDTERRSLAHMEPYE